ncbi:MAG: IS110 family transposase [Micropepsaceae bacterium]
MGKITRIGMDTSKKVFQLHGVDEAGQVVLKKKLYRDRMLAFFAALAPTKIGIEACGAAHYWARELSKLGHEVVLIAAQHAKRYVKRNKNDPADAAAICEAMSRPDMTFVPVKSVDRQAALMLAGVRDRLTGTQTQIANSIRGYASEFGHVAPTGLDKIDPLIAGLARDATLPKLAREMFATLAKEFAYVGKQLAAVEAKLMTWFKSNETSRRLDKIAGVGPVGASLLVLKTPAPHVFPSARHFAAWMGLTPKDHSTGGKQRLGSITHAGDELLRSVLVAGAMSVCKVALRKPERVSPWLRALVARKPLMLAAVALANKNARIAWKMMMTGEAYDATRSPRVAQLQAAA